MMHTRLIGQVYMAVIAICIGPTVYAEESTPLRQLFTNVMVFDGSGEDLFRADVLVNDNKIESLEYFSRINTPVLM